MGQDTQVESVVRLVTAVLGEDLVGVYPHGSAVLGGLRPTSDLDLLAVCRRATTARERRALVEGLLDLSGRRARLGPGRPIELTVVVESQVRPWRYPPPVEFQYGEWLRDEYERGLTPAPGVEPDVALIASVALVGGDPLAGPPLTTLLDPVPVEDLRRASVAGVTGLMDDLSSDTRNVLLTLARIWTTLATGLIRSKDAAADWASARLPADHRPTMARARDEYLRDDEHHDWVGDLDDARSCAHHIGIEIDRLTRVEDDEARST
jgi:streptomycin 3"-adenylyltransferase